LFHSRQAIHPTNDDLSFTNPHLLEYAKNQFFHFSMDGGGFIAFNPPNHDFFLRSLPNLLRSQYFFLFIMALQERFELMSLSSSVSEKWVTEDIATRALAFENVRDALLDFRARGQFTQIMQKENPHRVYRKWQEVFQVEQLFQEVNDEAKDMFSFLQDMRSKRLEASINVLTALIGIPSLIISFLGLKIAGLTHPNAIPWWLAIFSVFGIGFLAGYLILWRLQQRV
jgi:hypothetical protein